MNQIQSNEPSPAASSSLPAWFDHGSAPTMSSREIAELTGSTHDNVLKTIRKLIGEGVVFGNETPYHHPQNGQRYNEFLLDYRNTMVVVSGYSAALRARIIDRWQELETRQQAAPAQLTRMDLIQLALAAEQELQSERSHRVALENKVETDAPKVAFAESVAAAPDAISIGQAAKILGTGRNRLAALMRKHGWVTRTNEPYQLKITSGLLDVKIGSYEHPEKGLQRSVTTLVTGKGLAGLRVIVQPQAAH
jgi:phage antirepressor YoqD-like protein